MSFTQLVCYLVPLVNLRDVTIRLITTGRKPHLSWQPLLLVAWQQKQQHLFQCIKCINSVNITVSLTTGWREIMTEYKVEQHGNNTMWRKNSKNSSYSLWMYPSMIHCPFTSKSPENRLFRCVLRLYLLESKPQHVASLFSEKLLIP